MDADNDGQAREDFDYSGAGATSNGASDNTATADATGSTDRSADALRCDFFLHVVRDDRGALRSQYRGDELIMRRFEQCLSADVLADTIPSKALPNTGGPPLLPLAALVLLGGGVLLGWFVMRRI